MSTIKQNYSPQDPIAIGLVENHREALIIYLDKDPANPGESLISVVTKLEKEGALSEVLISILYNLVQTNNVKKHSGKAKSYTNKSKNQIIIQHQNSSKTKPRQNLKPQPSPATIK
jgi:hypothetical protein